MFKNIAPTNKLLCLNALEMLPYQVDICFHKN